MAKAATKAATKKKPAAKKKAAPSAAAGSPAMAVRQFCALPPAPIDDIAALTGDPLRAELIRNNRLKWSNNETLRYMFLDQPAAWRGAANQKQVVRDAFAKWKALGIGLEFEEVTDASKRPQIRISFDMASKRSWSYVGRDAVNRIKDMRQATMNFGWDVTTEYGRDTALHEIGHSLGFEHEHQNPNAGIVWNEDKVYDYFEGQDWSRDMTKRNVIDKMPTSEVTGTVWDPNSVMHYWFAAGLIEQPAKYKASGLYPAGGLSQLDIERVVKFYPPRTAQRRTHEIAPFESRRLDIAPNEQADFVFVPQSTRRYSIETLGEVDAFISLFEEVDGVETFVAAEDNSAIDKNALVVERLVAGRKYVVRVRMHYAESVGDAGLVIY